MEGRDCLRTCAARRSACATEAIVVGYCCVAVCVTVARPFAGGLTDRLRAVHGACALGESMA